MIDKKRVLPEKVQFSYDYCQILADFNSVVMPGYRELYDRYPVAEGIRDISICMSNRATDALRVIDDIRNEKYSWGGIGWLLFYPGFVMAAEEMGMTAFEYADWIYANCDKINAEKGFRAAWI